MKSDFSDLKWMQEVYSIPNREAARAGDCPAPDRLWAAAEGKLSPETRRTIIHHTLHCWACAEGWRVAMRLGARPRVSVGTLVYDLVRQDLRLAERVAGRVAALLVSFARSLMAPPRRVPAMATVVVVVLGVGLLFFRDSLPGMRGFGPDRPVVREAGEPSASPSSQERARIESLVSEDEPLPRQHCVLRWSGPEGARYELRITTEDLSPVDSASGLTVPEYRIPPAKLKDLEPGSLLLWQVTPLLPERSPRDLKTFRARIE